MQHKSHSFSSEGKQPNKSGINKVLTLKALGEEGYNEEYADNYIDEDNVMEVGEVLRYLVFTSSLLC